MVFRSHEILQEGLDACITKILTDTDSPLVFAHACWGRLARASALRMTRIRTKNDQRIPLFARANTNGIDHMEAFQRHIIRFGRSGTLLNWIARWMYQNCIPNPGQQHQKMIPKSFRFLVTDRRNVNPLTGDDHSIVISKRVFQTLDDRGIVMKYLDELYSRDTQVHPSDGNIDALSYPSQQLISLRYDTRRLLKTEHECIERLRSFSRLYQQDPILIPDEECDWMFLGALQTGFMYVQSAVGVATEARGFVSVGACYRFRDKRPEECPLGIISAVIPANVMEPQIEKFVSKVQQALSDILDSTITNIENCQGKPLNNHLFRVERDKTGDWDANKLWILADALSLSFQPEEGTQTRPWDTPPFPLWQPALLLWLTLVIEGLRGTMHEGNPLNFYFVIADRSLVLDSGLFEVVELQPNAQSSLIPWDTNGAVMSPGETGKLLDRVRQQVGKKNYAWFLDGKFALLWDATFPSQFPWGLIRFKESSWEVFLNHAHMRKPSRADRIISAMVHVSPNGSGGVILHRRQIASFRKGQPWIIGIGDREQKLTTCLRRHLNDWGLPHNGTLEHTIEFLKEALLAVSDNPHTGCILMLLEPGNNQESLDRVFDNMGEPWETQHGDDLLQKNLDELTSLMAMDGATCVYADLQTLRPKIAFRRLVRVPDTAIREIFSPDKEELDGEGSRKWSAAHAATRHEVSAVISVSLDGPIHIYEFDSAEVKVRIRKLSEYPVE